MKNNIRLGLGILTVLATPFAVDAATGSSEAHAAQDTVKSAQVAKTTNKEEVKTTTQKQVESATKTEATKVETTIKENTKVEGTKKEATVNKEEATKKEETTKKDASSDKQASSVKTVSGKPQAPTPNAAEKKTGWTKAGNTWFYYDAQGNQVKNTWVGSYWIGSDGKMVTNSWVDGGKYYVGSQGWWEKDAVKTGETRKGWTKAGSTWHFYNDKGNQVKNAWVGNYWIGSDGKMVTNSWVDGGKYYVGTDGKWVKGAATGNGSGALNNVLSIAQSYLGVEMGSAEHKKIVDAYNSVNPKPVGYTVKYSDDWCDVFVTTVFQQAGLSSLIGRECGVQRHIGIMQQKGIWQGKVLPKAGDVITFDWDGGGFADHIGIVESVKDGIVTTIEGNSSPYTSSGNTKVNRKTYNWNASYIKGYARPNY